MNNFIEIIKPFTIISRILLAKSNFVGAEMFPKIEFDYTCKNCQKTNRIEIEPLKTGYPLSDLYERKKLIDKQELLKNGVASLAKNWQTHLGELVLFNIAAMYLGHDCNNCGEKHLLVFGCGEVQPGRMECKISGIWKIKE